MISKKKANVGKEFISRIEKIEIPDQKTSVSIQIHKIRSEYFQEYMKSKDVEDEEENLFQFFKLCDEEKEDQVLKSIKGMASQIFESNKNTFFEKALNGKQSKTIVGRSQRHARR